MQRQVELIGAAWGLGGVDPGCADAPAVLAPLLPSRLRECGVSTLPGPILLASAVADSLRRGRLPCVLGGDHTCAGGTWTGVARTLRGELGLVWVDAHMDSHTPGTSHTGRLHGVPLAWLLGQDDDPLYGLASGVLDPRHVCLVGVRSYEPEESERLGGPGVRVYLMEEVRQRGLRRALDDALRIASQDTAGFGISIDLDVVTPEDAPGVAVPAEGGLGGAELARALRGIGGRLGLAAVELVEYCPRLDKGGRSAQVAVDLLAATLCGSRDDAKVVAEALHRKPPQPAPP